MVIYGIYGVNENENIRLGQSGTPVFLEIFGNITIYSNARLQMETIESVPKIVGIHYHK